ncbi:MAG: glucose-1-phosphate cytidylyltransferase [Victivallaceae bacterium]
MSDKSVEHKMPPAMILCGGMGTRLRDVTELLPKPMVPVGTQPIIWHIMKGYAAYGVTRFILCLGYKRECFVDYFLNYHAHAADITVTLGQHRNIVYHNHSGEEEWEVTLADTGLETMTGGRILRAGKYLKDSDEDFFLTYGDAVSNVNIKSLHDAHLRHGKMLTLTAVHPAGRFGEINMSGSQVTGFTEKPPAEGGYINGGFMVAKRQLIDKYIPAERDTFFEREPMQMATADGQISAYKHHGFWQCMDTPREHALLNSLWQTGNAPWTEAW